MWIIGFINVASKIDLFINRKNILRPFEDETPLVSINDLR